MNVIMLMGFLGQDPETKEVNSTTVTNFSMATTERWTDKQGEKQNVTTWHRCVAWGKQGEVIAKYFSKGDPIQVTGSLQKREYEKDGEKKQAVDVKITGFNFVPAKKDKQHSLPVEPAIPAGTPNEAPSFDKNESMPF